MNEIENLEAEIARLRIVDAVRWERMQRVLAMNDDLRADLDHDRAVLGAVAALVERADHVAATYGNGAQLHGVGQVVKVNDLRAVLAPVSGAVEEDAK